MNPLQRASLFTLTIIFSFIFTVIILIGIYYDYLSLPYAIALTIAINFLLWLVGPKISDFIYKHFYKTQFLTQEEVSDNFPDLYDFINSVALKYKFKFPKIGIIDDKNPTAFTYGSTRNNARLIFTTGINHYLNPEEVRAVIAHELGHIHHNDFVIMSIAITFVQILYEIYVFFSKSKKQSSKKKGDILYSIGLLAYIFYLISNYLILYLSRVREYYADNFSAYVTRSPNSLVQALVKIAYGIVQAEDSSSSKRLLEATRSMGILDIKNAGFIGALVYVSANPEIVAEVMAFDNVSPWAPILELFSTHPLTGKRIAFLENIATELNQQKIIDFNSAYRRMNIDKTKLYANFYLELFLYFLPWLLIIPGFLILGIGGAILAIGLGILVKTNYQMSEGIVVQTNIVDEMRNVYASPMRGKRVAFAGKIVGRGMPGFIFSEDMMLQDNSGLIYLNYNSIFGFIGDLFFAIKKVKKLMGQLVNAEGWFFRGITQTMTLSQLMYENQKIKSHPKAWSIISSVLLILLGLLIVII